MTDFRHLGLRDELLRALEDEGLERPTALQEAVIPVLRRGGNLVARAGTGSGKTLAYGLGVLDRLEAGKEEVKEEGSHVRVLVLRPTVEAAEATALGLFPYAQAVGLATTVPGGSWGTPVEVAEVVVSPPEAVLETVRGSSLKLDTVEAVVVDGAAAIEELGNGEALETLLDHLPRDAQRILLTTSFTAAIDDLADRRVKRALRYPAEAAVPPATAEPTRGEIGYVVVPEAHKLELLARALAGRAADGAAPVLFCRTDERAAVVAEALTTRGFVLGEPDDEDADAVLASAGTSRAELLGETGADTRQSISFDVPPDEATLLSRHEGDADAILLLAPEELPHMRDIAARARLGTRAVTLPIATPVVRGVTAFRDELRSALREEDLGAQMLVLEPLFEEFSPAEVAAAAAALLRRRTPAPFAARGEAAAPAAGKAASLRPLAESSAGPPPTTWARLFVGIGSRDGIRPGDLVGAIAGEADIPGSSVGKIDIRDSFSIVEVQAGAADKVIGALNGTTMKGRSLRVDYDRGADRARKAPGRRPEGPGRRPEGPRGGGQRRTVVRRPQKE